MKCLMAAEITREKIFLRLHDELPYASTVETEKWKRQKNGDVRIDQVIYVRRDSQKPIVLGKGGKTIKDIGAAARRDMQDWLGVSRKSRPVLQPGNKVKVEWRGRLSEHLGNFTVEPLSAQAAEIMENRLSLAGLNAICAIARECLPEREAHFDV